METNQPVIETASEKIAEHANEGKKLYPVVAIGASAGGLEAISALLQQLPPDLGMVYVIIQHLLPAHESILPELLEKRTNMPVHQVTDGMMIAQNNVYVIPPGMYMSIVDSKLLLSPRIKTESGFSPIDFFMMALAGVYQNLALGVILSGTANDGMEGIRHIKVAGGITFAQDESARFQGMPRSAIDSGFVDFVLSPEGIAKELDEISKKPYSINPEEVEETSADAELQKIYVILYSRKNVDFSLYKQTIIRRRILRRMSITKVKAFAEYVTLLRSNAEEQDLLYRDLLINVTSFFRDQDVYEALTGNIFPHLLKNRKSNDPVRIWCPACATGEEAYSIAICLFEYLKEKAISLPVQIFGTDLSELAVEKARAGLYSASALQNVSPQRQKRFFTQSGDRFQITKAIRNVCVFARQNLLKDPPFSNMDLISCQNALIYLTPEPQQKLLHSFHYGLKPSGFLLIGKSEDLGNAANLFTQVGKDLEIFTKKPNSKVRLDFSHAQAAPQAPEVAMEASEQKTFGEREENIDVEKESERLLLSRYVPASIIINNDYQIFRFHGPIYKYLQPVSGKASLHLLKMIREDLVYELRNLVQQAKKEGQLVRKDSISTTADGYKTQINIEVVPVKSNAKEAYFLVLFDENPNIHFAKPKAVRKRVVTPEENDHKILSLEHDLQEVREQMNNMTEEFEATHEELQSANEEVLSSNEELQSINEELETSKEELQSVNEELLTINEELQSRNKELQESIVFSKAIVETIREPLLLLHPDLRIFTANNAFYKTYKLTQQSVEGVFLYKIDGGRWNVPELSAKISEIAGQKKGHITFELAHLFKDKTLLFTAMNLKMEFKKVDWILLTVQDITVHHQVLQTKEWLAVVVDSSGEGIISFSTNRNVISWNKGAQEIFGYTAEEMIGYSISKLVKPEEKQRQLKLIERVMRGEMVRQHEMVWVNKDGHSIQVSVSISAIKNDRGDIQGLMASVQDITERKQAEENLQTAQQSLQVALEAANIGVWEVDVVNNVVLNHNLLHDQIYGYKTRQPVWNTEVAMHYVLEEDKYLLQAANERMTKTGKMQAEVRVKWPDDSIHWILIMGRYFYNKDGEPVRAAGTVMDITDRKLLERQKVEFISVASHELKTPVTSIKAYTEILHEQFVIDQNTDAANMMEKMEKQVDKLTNLIKDLLDVTRITEGQLVFHPEEFDLNELIKEIVEDMQRGAVKHTINLQLAPLPPIWADKDRTGQVITNLVSNAIKYSPGANEVIISSKAEDGHLVVGVQDFGVGIPAASQSRIFDQFFRVTDIKTSTFPGLGLGLFISAEIIKRQKGNIAVQSKEGKGSTFFFSLPVK